MAGRQRSTFQKRQKEMKRQETQKLKAEKRNARKQERALSKAAGPEGSEVFEGSDVSENPLPGTEEVGSQD